MVEVIGSSPTAPTNTKTARNFACRFRIDGGVNGLVTRHSPDTDYPKTFQMPSFVNLPEGQIFAVGFPLAGNGKAPTAPGLVVRINEYRAKSPVFFCYWWGVNGLVTRNSPDIDFPKTSKCRRSSICPMVKFLP